MPVKRPRARARLRRGARARYTLHANKLVDPHPASTSQFLDVMVIPHLSIP